MGSPYSDRQIPTVPSVELLAKRVPSPDQHRRVIGAIQTFGLIAAAPSYFNAHIDGQTTRVNVLRNRRARITRGSEKVHCEQSSPDRHHRLGSSGSPLFCWAHPTGTHSSTHVQLMSARACVQISTAPDYELGVAGTMGPRPRQKLPHRSRSGRARCARAASLDLLGPPVWAACTQAPTRRDRRRYRRYGPEASWHGDGRGRRPRVELPEHFAKTWS